MTNKEVKAIVAEAYCKAIEKEKKNCEFYIAMNPGSEAERNKQMQIAIAGIDNLYYTIADLLPR